MTDQLDVQCHLAVVTIRRQAAKIAADITAWRPTFVIDIPDDADRIYADELEP